MTYHSLNGNNKTAHLFRTLHCLAVFFLLPAQLLLASEYDQQFIDAELERTIVNPDNSTAIKVDQPIGLVFDALLSRLAEYTENITRIDFDHSSAADPATLSIGSERITTMDDGRKLVQRIIIFEPPNRFAYFTDMSLSTVNVPIDYSIGYYTFAEQSDGKTAATVAVAYKPSSRLTAFLVRLGFNRALSKDFEKAQAYLNSLGRN
ncbi:MAG: hypothetical protein P8N94_03780 [Gammaproteobacteria bacterium]|nr:hypothetical protein [Gammaproteobacteria bacterium]MDG2337095.1 hypothetical protein [Gammaproteobacteria bacterium]